MKHLLFFGAMALLLSSCEPDPFPLELTRFDVTWFDVDESGNQTLDDRIHFDVLVSITDPESDEQFITQWEFAYFVNGSFGGVLLGDDRTNANSVTAQLDVTPRYLQGPGQTVIKPGDIIEFRLWAIDNHGTQLEQFHTIALQP